MKGRIRVIGVGDDGCLSLTSRAINAVAEAEILAGASRHLAFFPQFQGERLKLTTPIEGYLQAIAESARQRDVCVLASGDPMFFGIGSRIKTFLDGLEHPPELEIIPSLSAMQLACARLGWASQETGLLSVHGRPLAGLVARLQQGGRFVLLTDAEHNPRRVASHLLEFGETHWRVHLCEALGGVNERVRTFGLEELAQGQAEPVQPLNLMMLERTDALRWGGYPGHCPDDAYAKRTPDRGLITKAPVRAVAVANLRVQPDSVVWDLGAGSGSIGIEAAKQAWQGQVYAVECNPQCYSTLEANRFAHRVDNLTLIKGRAPQALQQLPDPDAVFCGGSRGEMAAIFELAMARLKPGGRLVFSAVTLESLSELHQLCRGAGVDAQVLMLSAAHGQSLAHYTRYQGDNPIHLFTIEKRAEGQ
ncbi:precorrin-6y C5,15-methyltransferase (decarboxylating) subunit CbiE [Ferrimonas sp.]|uniref:precorrin-6y C5,15-methyltransferase (decarboxylating) subunit CbiE n=1 Tax=Ferrimonas sp. TaxID=2080861 RepID=UPI003A940AFE